MAACSTVSPGRGDCEATRQAEELSRIKGQFLAILNHEIRTPLSGIMGMTDLLLETKLDAEQREYLTAARSCAENLLALFNAMLEFSDLAAGRLSLDELEFDLPGVLRSAVSVFSSRAERKGLRLTCRLDGNFTGVALGDAFRLRQALSYLVDNAVKFTHAGEVVVEAIAEHRPENRLSLSVRVRDTGIGISSDDLGAIFEPCCQLDKGLSRGYTGLGLGLAIAQKVVHLMGGEISVESKPGAGSIFSFTIPLKIPPEHAACAPPISAGRSEAPRILVVEDNSVAQRVATHILQKRNYSVTCAASGPEAVAAASAERYNLILMDLQIPVMDGLATTAAIRRLPGYEHVPVLALTGNASEEYRRLCLRHGMQAFLSKPVDPGELLETVACYL